MGLTILGEHPFAQRGDGTLKSRIGTVFIKRKVLVTLPGVHATQRVAHTGRLNEERAAQGLPALTDEEQCAEWQDAVDLIIDPGTILIRPDPANMPLAFAADELLQELVSKRNIRFLYAREERVRQAIRERGEYWRITPLPQSPDEIVRMIEGTRMAIRGRSMYYYNRVTGTRFVTLAQFELLANLSDGELWDHLNEIFHHATNRVNHLGYPEMDFFAVDGRFSSADLAEVGCEKADASMARTCHARILERFRAAVPPELREDNPDSPGWRNRMFLCLIAQRDETISEEVLQGLNPEFFMQIRWLPGARIEEGELMFDPIFEEVERNPQDASLRELCDEKVKGFVCNYIRDFGDLEHVNIGRVAPGVRQHDDASSHRAYIAEAKLRGHLEPVVRIIRLQKWGIQEHIDLENKDLLRSIMEAEDYTDYTLDRRVGCWQLGMPLPSGIITRRVSETYYGKNRSYHGIRIWTTYFERDYIKGVATDKIPVASLHDERFSNALARLLGRAAAPNLIVGRVSLNGKVIFDDGDEILLMDERGLPREIVVADHAGTFTDYESDLMGFADAYARPVLARAHLVRGVAGFAQSYLEGFGDEFRHVQQEYRKRRRAFDTLFKHSKQDVGAFSWRWKNVLARLDRTDVSALADRIRQYVSSNLTESRRVQFANSPPA